MPRLIYSLPPVTSVNSMTGDVTVTPVEVGLPPVTNVEIINVAPSTDQKSFSLADIQLAITEYGGPGFVKPETPVTASVTAAPGTMVRVDTDIAPVTVTLPAVPVDGTLVAVQDIGYNAHVNNIFIDPAGATIADTGIGLLLEKAGSGVLLVFSSYSNDWTIISSTDSGVDDAFFDAVKQASLYGFKNANSSSLTFGYFGGNVTRSDGTTVQLADGTVLLSPGAVNYVVANKSTGGVSASTGLANWNDQANYWRLYNVTTNASGITAKVDARQIGRFTSDASAHISSTANPHGTTKAQVGLGNVDNTSDMNKPISTAAAAALATKLDSSDASITNSREWTAATVTQAEAEAGTATTRRAWTAERVRQAINAWWAGSTQKSKLDGVEAGAQVNTVASVQGRVGAVVVTKNDLALNNVDNTSDMNKPLSIATTVALGGKVNVGDPALTDSREWTAATVSVAEAEGGLDTNRRAWTVERVWQAINAWWNMSAAKSKLDGVEAGAQVNTVTSVQGRVGPVIVTKNDLGVNNVDNTSDMNKPISTATAAALATKLNASDVSVTNSREWIADTVTLAEAENGISTTRRAWTAERIRQAMLSWWNLSADKTKLDGIQPNANNYVHPSFHLATVITEDANHRFVTDLDIANWNSGVGAAALVAAHVAAADPHPTYLTLAEMLAAAPVKSVAAKAGNVVLVKGDVGLGNVDNTADLDKPISTATAAALTTKESAVVSGTTAQYYRGDKTWQNLAPVILSTSLSGINVASTGSVSAADTVLSSIGKLQASKEANITAGTTSQFYRGDKTWVDFGTATRTTSLTGVDVVTTGAVSAADTVLSSIGKLQASKEGNVAAGTTAQYYRGDKTWVDLQTDVRATVLTGLNTTVSAPLAATDTVLASSGKLQAQINEMKNTAFTYALLGW